ETEVARKRRGVDDPFEEHRKRPIGELVDEYLGYLRSKGNTAKHVDLTETRLRAVIDGCEFTRIGDLDETRVSVWLAKQRESGKGVPDPRTGKPRGVSAQTSNYYLQAIAGFARWLTKGRRLGYNPLVSLSPIN